jgi:hypothetical protein
MMACAFTGPIPGQRLELFLGGRIDVDGGERHRRKQERGNEQQIRCMKVLRIV